MSSNDRPSGRRSRKFRILLVLALIVGLIWIFGPGGAVHVAPGSTLVVELSGQYVEAATPTLLARVFGDNGKPFMSLLSLFNLAERDDRIDTVILHIRDVGIGWGKAAEVRDSIGRLREAGRKTIAYLELDSFSINRAYYIATAAEEIYVVPGAVMPLVGLLFAEYLYFGEMWEKVGIEIEASKVGKYKSAVETLAGREMSDASREMSNSLLDGAEKRFVSAIATGRGLPPERVRAIIDEGLVTTHELISRGLVDGILHLDEIPEAQNNRIEGRDYRSIDPTSAGFQPTVQMALIYGSGAVVSGNAQRSAGGGPVFAAGRIVRALENASENPNIRGIVLRIDSPGGSPMASELIWHAIGEVREGGMPVVVSVSDVAASGAYYVAAAADAIVIPPGALTGSIGVFALRPIFEGLMEKLGVGVETLQRGRHADFYSSSKPFSPETKDRMQILTREIYKLFVDRVASGRNLEQGQVDTLGQGRVWSAEQALEVGLVDELGGIREAVRWILRDQELDEDTDVALISYPEPLSFADEIADLFQSGTLLGLRPVVSPPAAALALLPLPHGLSALRDWVIDLPLGGPLLIPSVLIEIR
ncbi:MAG: signal peptide peptidase SppA [Deltaproteobacteria bacterium]|nr:signal peptide peptidase SppA [Deltaproteobacteria bacterium]